MKDLNEIATYHEQEFAALRERSLRQTPNQLMGRRFQAAVANPADTGTLQSIAQRAIPMSRPKRRKAGKRHGRIFIGCEPSHTAQRSSICR